MSADSVLPRRARIGHCAFPPSESVVTDGKTGAMRLTVEVTLRAGRSEVWAAVSTVGGINREVAPFIRVTDPTDGAPFDAEPWRSGTPVTWQLLFGVIPVDRHRIELVALPDGGGFRESSSSWWHRVWRHERTLLDDPGAASCATR